MLRDKRFSPEFVNRIDSVITYKPLDRRTSELILDRQIEAIHAMLTARLGQRTFSILVTKAAKRTILEKGISAEFGARELKRVLQRDLMQPLAAIMAEEGIQAGETIVFDRDRNRARFSIPAHGDETAANGHR